MAELPQGVEGSVPDAHVLVLHELHEHAGHRVQAGSILHVLDRSAHRHGSPVLALPTASGAVLLQQGHEVLLGVLEAHLFNEEVHLGLAGPEKAVVVILLFVLVNLLPVIVLIDLCEESEGQLQGPGGKVGDGLDQCLALGLRDRGDPLEGHGPSAVRNGALGSCEGEHDVDPLTPSGLEEGDLVLRALDQGLEGLFQRRGIAARQGFQGALDHGQHGLHCLAALVVEDPYHLADQVEASNLQLRRGEPVADQGSQPLALLQDGRRGRRADELRQQPEAALLVHHGGAPGQLEGVRDQLRPGP
mmetsp:Transcript_56782/g.146146  ORF Transcript_56782/g.146146 Transcript_56782/m.146146 type:complete len:303 (+) Transcript_56782:1868-2776(+)